eukprot:4156925-Prorocentrum_lima.AAC.1
MVLCSESRHLSLEECSGHVQHEQQDLQGHEGQLDGMIPMVSKSKKKKLKKLAKQARVGAEEVHTLEGEDRTSVVNFVEQHVKAQCFVEK